MIHTIELAVASDAALDFWADRLGARGYPSERTPSTLRFADYDGLQFELVAADDSPALRARHPGCLPSMRSPGSEAPAPTPRTPASRSAS